MSGRGVNASLQDQMARLHDSMSARDKRRTQQHDMRQSSKDDNPYEDRKRVAGRGRPGVGQDINASAAARAAVASASAIEGPRMISCDICGVSYAKESGMQQHLEGPTHKKAVEKQKAEQRRLEQLGNNRWAAENAAGAAAWQQLDTKYKAAQRAPAPEPAAADASPPRPSSGGGGSSGRGRGRGLPLPVPLQKPKHKTSIAELAAAAMAERARAAHSQMVAAAQVDDGPLSIGGWVPPTVTVPAIASRAKPAAASAADAAAFEDEAGMARGGESAEQQEPDADGQAGAEGAEAARDGDVGSGSEDSDSDSSDSGSGGLLGRNDKEPRSFF